MNRTERFERGLAITARVFELAGKYNWTTEQISHALFQGSDESLPIGLHYVGKKEQRNPCSQLILGIKHLSQ